MFIVTKRKYDELERMYNRKSGQNMQLESANDLLTSRIDRYEKEIDKMSKQYKSSTAAKGGLTKENNKLRNKIQKLEKVIHLCKYELEEYKKQSNVDKDTIISLSTSKHELIEQNYTLKNTAIELNNLLKKKSKRYPTVSDIVNYDKKNPIRKK